MIHSIHFTLEEAGKVLKIIQPFVERMMALKKIIDSKGLDIYKHPYFSGVALNGSGKYDQEIEEIVDLSKKISSKGVLIKSIDKGLIDFPHIRSNGEEIYLCWKADEEKISSWHRIRDGFAGRKPIDEL